MPLADPTATISQVEQSNDNIQLVINAMRPYGATPIAGMLQDLKYYYWSDPSGPQPTDPYVQGNCRDEYAILLTDGAPNLDLRPYCTPEGDNPLGHCPYSLPEDIATQLYSGNDGHISGHRIITYVVGFNVNHDQRHDADGLLDARRRSVALRVDVRGPFEAIALRLVLHARKSRLLGVGRHAGRVFRANAGRPLERAQRHHLEDREEHDRAYGARVFARRRRSEQRSEHPDHERIRVSCIFPTARRANVER